MRKSKLVTACKQFLSLKSPLNKNSKKSLDSSGKKDRINKIRSDIVNFFVRDDVSSIVPAKKSIATKHKCKMHKRYLCDTMVRLHTKFLSESLYKVSFATFCKFRPFFVMVPNAISRETCLCVTHENMKHYITALYHNNIITVRSISGVLKQLCCGVDDVRCLLRNCEACTNKKLSY